MPPISCCASLARSRRACSATGRQGPSSSCAPEAAYVRAATRISTSTQRSEKMSIFNQKSKFKVKTEVRKVKQVVAPKPVTNAPGASSSSSTNVSLRGTPRASPAPASSLSVKRVHQRPSASLSPSPQPPAPSTSNPNRKRPALVSRRSTASASPAPVLSDSEPGSEDDEDWRERLDPSKRRKRAHTEDPGRRLRHPKLWTGDGDDEIPAMVHSADVASLETKCQPVMRLERDEVVVHLRYPGAKSMER